MRETLGQYVARVMIEKRLKPEEVKKLSGGEITDGYIRIIVAERAKNPSVKKLQALARGLNVNEEQLFRVARGLPPEDLEDGDDLNYAEIINLLHESLKNRTLAELLHEVVRLSPESQKLALAVLRTMDKPSDVKPKQKKRA